MEMFFLSFKNFLLFLQFSAQFPAHKPFQLTTEVPANMKCSNCSE